MLSEDFACFDTEYERRSDPDQTAFAFAWLYYTENQEVAQMLAPQNMPGSHCWEHNLP
jgi:hypothetical protein